MARSNDVLSLAVSANLRIAAAVWLTPRIGTIANARLECLKIAIEQLLRHRPDFKLWLVAGHRTTQPDTRITRYLGLWKSLEKRKVDIPAGDFTRENMVTSENGLRFFGAVRFPREQLEKVCSILAAESASIVALDETSGRKLPEELVMRGWAQKSARPPEDILEFVCSQGGTVVEFFGEFDDAEVAVAVLGNEDLVVRLNN